MTWDESTPASIVVTKSTSDDTALKHYTNKQLCQENFDLIAKVIELLTSHDLWDHDGFYTFNDGERWARLEELEDE